MNKRNCEKFTKIILEATNLDNIDEALFLLIRKQYIEYNCIPKLVYIQVADVLLGALRSIDFNKNIYDRHNVSMYLQKHFKGWGSLKHFLKPINDEIQHMINDSVNKLEEIIANKFTERELKEKIFARRVICSHDIEDYTYYIKKLNLNFNSSYSGMAYTIVIDKYNNKFNTFLGSANQRTDKKIELLNEKFNYKLKEKILSLQQSKYTTEYIVNYLDINNNLYRNICKKIGLKKSNYKNKSIKLNININEEEINAIEDFNIKLCDEISVKEGKRRLCIHYKIERDCKIVKLAKKYFKKKYHGKLICECCGFNFQDKYGELGKDYIIAHHENPLGENEGEVETKVNDFRMVCCNCHNILHRGFPCLKVEELKNIMIKQEIKRQQDQY